MLVPMQGAAAELVPDVYGSLSFGACMLLSLQAAAGCRCQMFMVVRGLGADISCYLGSMLS